MTVTAQQLEMPACDFVPRKYEGPSKDEILAMRRQFTNPEFEKLEAEERELLHAGRIIPTHPLTAGISGKTLRRLVHTALDAVADQLVDPLPAEIRAALDEGTYATESERGRALPMDEAIAEATAFCQHLADAAPVS